MQDQTRMAHEIPSKIFPPKDDIIIPYLDVMKILTLYIKFKYSFATFGAKLIKRAASVLILSSHMQMRLVVTICKGYLNGMVGYQNA